MPKGGGLAIFRTNGLTIPSSKDLRRSRSTGLMTFLLRASLSIGLTFSSNDGLTMPSSGGLCPAAVVYVQQRRSMYRSGIGGLTLSSSGGLTGGLAMSMNERRGRCRFLSVPDVG